MGGNGRGGGQAIGIAVGGGGKGREATPSSMTLAFLLPILFRQPPLHTPSLATTLPLTGIFLGEREGGGARKEPELMHLRSRRLNEHSFVCSSVGSECIA